MKKLNQKGFTHHLVMFAILAIVLGAMGFAGWRVYQSRSIDAKAAAYSDMRAAGPSTVSVYGCVTLTKLPNGSDYATFKAYAKNKGKTDAKWQVNIATFGGGTSARLGGTVKAKSKSNVHRKSFTYTPGSTVANASVEGTATNSAPLFTLGKSSLKSC